MCGDGTVSTRSCINGECAGTSACEDACSGSGGWQCTAPPPTAVDFDCQGKTCNTGREYCLVSIINGVFNDSNCRPLASCAAAVQAGDSTAACDCFKQDARSFYSGANNCSSAVSCMFFPGEDLSAICNQSL